MFRDRNLAKIGARLGWRWRTKRQVSRDDVKSLVLGLSHGLFHDNLVQSASEVNLYFIKNTRRFHLTSIFKVFRGCCHV